MNGSRPQGLLAKNLTRLKIQRWQLALFRLFRNSGSGVQVQFQLKLSSTDDAMRDAEIVGQKRRDTAFVVLRWYLLRNPPERESSEPGLPFERGSQKRIDHYAELYSGKLECDLGGDDSSGYQTRENG